MRILLTGARAPVALELTRRFGAAGQHVLLADSVRFPLAGWSRHARAVHRIPGPAQDPAGFAAALATLACDLVVPTCEEAVWLSRLSFQQLPLFAPPFPTVLELHDKGRFIERCQAKGVPVPESWRLTSPEEARRLSGELVFKPVFSRFGTRTQIRPARVELPASPAQPWLAQRFLPGRLVCSYSVVRAGRLRAHCVYRPRAALQGGAGMLFESVDHPGVDEWVERFLAGEGWSGQLSLDFIEGPDGSVQAIECNPRTTSGVHLFADDARLAGAFLEDGPLYRAEPGRRAALELVAPLAAWRAGARPVVARRDDPWPILGQALSLAEMAARSVRFRLRLLEATTRDIAFADAAARA